MVAREATFLISVATEEFIKRIAEESSIIAARENRITVQYRDLGTYSCRVRLEPNTDDDRILPAAAVRRVEKFMFLDGNDSRLRKEAPSNFSPQRLYHSKHRRRQLSASPKSKRTNWHGRIRCWMPSLVVGNRRNDQMKMLL